MMFFFSPEKKNQQKNMPKDYPHKTKPVFLPIEKMTNERKFKLKIEPNPEFQPPNFTIPQESCFWSSVSLK